MNQIGQVFCFLFLRVFQVACSICMDHTKYYKNNTTLRYILSFIGS